MKRQLTALLHTYPQISQLGIVMRSGNLDAYLQFWELSSAIDDLSVVLKPIYIQDDKRIETSLAATMESVQAIYTACDAELATNAIQTIADFALQHNLLNLDCSKVAQVNDVAVDQIFDFSRIGHLAGIKAAELLNDPGFQRATAVR